MSLSSSLATAMTALRANQAALSIVSSNVGNAQTPGYLTGQPYRAGPLALFWVEQGNAYVLANIRGGGEYGPRWHEAALRERRQNSFDDLHAVAEDVKRAGIASKVAISGRSNGGVLLGAALNQRPDL